MRSRPDSAMPLKATTDLKVRGRERTHRALANSAFNLLRTGDSNTMGTLRAISSKNDCSTATCRSSLINIPNRCLRWAWVLPSCGIILIHTGRNRKAEPWMGTRMTRVGKCEHWSASNAVLLDSRLSFKVGSKTFHDTYLQTCATVHTKSKEKHFQMYYIRRTFIQLYQLVVDTNVRRIHHFWHTEVEDALGWLWFLFCRYSSSQSQH